MNFFKKINAFLLAAVVALGIAPAALADQPALPDENRDGTSSITVHKYYVESLDQFTTRATGDKLEDDAVIYDDGQGTQVKLDELSPLKGIDFRVTRVVDTTTSTNKAEEYTGPGQSYKQTLTTGTNGQVEFERLPFGLYLLEELASADVLTPMEPFLVSVPLTNPTREGWLYDLHIYPKNVLESNPEIDKNIVDGKELIESDTVSVGGTVTWQIDVDIPAGIAISQKYTVTDVLDSRLSYAGGLEVSYANKVGSSTTLPATAYTATEPNSNGGGTLIVDFNESEMRQELAKALLGEPANGSDPLPPTLTIRFNTTVNETARTAGNMGEEIPNQAKLEFTNGSGLEHNPESPEPEVHTGGLRIHKVAAGENGADLEFAKFKIYPTEQDALAGTGALEEPEGTDDWVVTTDENGIATFLGLAYGDYWIVEVQAPEGYNLLAAPKKVEVTAETHLATGEIKVENKAGFVLPVTGGTGTLLFTIGGAALVGCAAILLFLSRKKKKSV